MEDGQVKPCEESPQSKRRFKMTSTGRKITLIILVIGVLATGISTAVGAAKKPFAGVTITVSNLTGPSSDEIRRLTPRFEKLTGIKVIVDDLPYLTLREKQIIELTGKTGVYDLLGIDHIWFGEYSSFLLPLDNYIQRDKSAIDYDDFMPSLAEAYGQWENKTYGFPFHPDVSALYYREDLFTDPANKAAFRAKYGYELAPPETWKQFRDVAEFFTRDYNGDGEIDFFGFASAYVRGEHIVCDYLDRLWGFGGEFLDENWRPVFNDDVGLRALEFYLDTIKYGPPGMTSYAHDETTTAFTEGKVAMVVQWTYFFPQFKDPTVSKIPERSGYAVLPGKRPVLGGWGMGISRDSKNPDAAWEFLKWITSKEIAKEWMEGAVPARRSILESPEFIKKYPHFPAMKKGYAGAKMRPRIPEYPKISEIFALELSEAVAGRKTPEKALDDAANQITEILRKAGYYR